MSTADHGSFWENAALDGAAYADAMVDAPVWIANKVLGTDIPAPLNNAANVYAMQTDDGSFIDPSTGAPLSPEQVAALAAKAEDKGAIIDAAKKTVEDLTSWLEAGAVVVGVVLVAVLALQVVGASK